jgi:hypothetical protein
LTRVEILLLIAQQHQATHSKVIPGETKSNDDRRAGAHAKTAKYKATSMNSRTLQVAKGHESLVRLIESACCVSDAFVAHLVQLIRVVATLVR